MQGKLLDNLIPQQREGEGIHHFSQFPDSCKVSTVGQGCLFLKKLWCRWGAETNDWFINGVDN